MDKVEQLVAECQDDEIVKIEAREGEQQFAVSKNLLCDTSKYFVAALKSDWKEASEGRLRIPGADVDTVKLFIYWLRKDSVPSFLQEIERAQSSDGSRRMMQINRLTLLARLWTLGDLILAPKLQNAAKGSLLELFSCKTTPFDAIYQGCQVGPKNSKLSKIFAAEAKYGYFDAQVFSTAEFEQLAAIPGFLEDFLCNVRDAVCDKEVLRRSEIFGYPGQEDDQDDFWVKE